MRCSSGPLRSLIFAVVCASAMAGCRACNWRGQGYGEQREPWTRNLRPPADESQFTGADAKARDIERSLGVR
ncbi:MAG: hypothetical protein WD063_09680 [Pirellulales bacterium]